MNVLNEIWKSLRASGHYSKSYEEFESKVKDPAYRNKVMNVMRAGGLLSDEMSSVLKEGGLESPKQKAIDKMAEGSSKKKDITTASSLADGSSDSQESFSKPKPWMEPFAPKAPEQKRDISENIDKQESFRRSLLEKKQPVIIKKTEPTEEDYFKGAFGDVLRGFDKVAPLGIGDFIDDMARSVSTGYLQGTAAVDADRLLLKGTKATPEQIENFVKSQKALSAAAPSAEMQDYQRIYEQEGKGFWGVVKGLVTNPTVIPEVVVSSLTAMATNTDALTAGATAIGTGAGIGAAAGAPAGGVGALPGAAAGAMASLPYAFGLASSVVEAGATFGEILTEELGGKEMTKENVRQILEDQEKLNSIRNKAIARGLIIGTVDALTGKLASGVGAKIISKGTATAETLAKATAAGAGIESLGGAGGEAAARAAIGQEMDISEISLEGISELPGGIRSTIQARLAKPIYKVNGEIVSKGEIDNIVNTMSPTDLAKTKIEIKNDYDGIKYKIQDKITTHSIREQVRQGNPELNEPSLNAITELEKELKKLEGNTTQTGKDRASAIRAKIKDIQQNQIQEEVKVETLSAEEQQQRTLGRAYNNQRIADLEKALSQPEDGRGTVVFDGKLVERTQLEKELENIKTEQDAIQKQAAGQVPVQPTTGVGEKVEEGVPQPKLEITPEQEERKTQLQEAIAQAGEAATEIKIGEEVIPMEQAQAELTQLVAPSVSIKTPTVAAISAVSEPDMTSLIERTTDEGIKGIVQQAQTAVKTLKSILPDFDIFIHEDEGSYNEAMKGVAGRSGSGGNFAYGVTPDGKKFGRIDINLGKANNRTVAHEVAHGVLSYSFGEAPDVFTQFKDKLTPILDAEANQYLNEFIKRYKDETIRPEEFLTEMTGLLTNQQAKLSVSTLQKIAALINEFVSKITNGKIKVFEDTRNTKDIADFFNTVSKRIQKGEAIAEAPQRLREKFGKGVVSEGAKAQMPISDIDVRDIRTKNRPGKKISKGLSVYTKDKKKVIEEAKDLSIEYVKENAPELFISNANIIASYPIVSGVKKFGAIKTLDKAQEVYDIFTNQIADNLKYLIDNFDPEYRDVSTLWYDGANIIAQNLSNKYGITEEQVAGIIASLSPQKDWYQNVRLAELVMMAFSENPVMTSQMIAKQKSILKEGEAPKLKAIRKAEEKYKLSRSKKNLESLSAKKKAHEKYMIKANNAVSNLEKYIGKSLNDVPDYIKPYMVRLHNEINTTKDYDVLRPDGEPMGVALKKDGVTKAKVAWGSYVEIGKAVSIYLDGSQENITRSLGEMHKIRNFYNNIIDPMSKENDVTMDTHAVAAALLMPLSGNSKEVGQNFGTGTSNSAPLGIKGLYYAFAEGYKKAAEDVNLLPRQVQSITWEAVRGLFTDTFKRDKAQVAKIKNIWDKFVNNKIDINEARKEIVNSAGGINPPTWATGGRGPVQEGVRGDVERGGVGRGGGVSERPAVGGKPGGRGGVVSKAQLTESKFIRDIGVLITPATVRGFDATTERIKKLSLKYDELVKKYAKTQSKATGDEIKRIEGRILDNVREKLTNDISKIKGASVKFGPARIGLWDNKFEPSFNMTLSVSPELNSDEISNLLFDFGERYSQDAFILETDSELNDKYINGEISLPLTEFDADGLNNYPQIVYTFADRINDNQVAELSNELQKNGIDAFSINNNELKISVLTFLSDEQTQNLSEDEQYAEKYRDFESKADAAATSVGDVLGRNENASLEIRIKKSHYAGAKNEGTQEQTREYDRSDIFKPFLKVTSKAQLPAHHGGPYDIDKFSTEKIGTGEGAQAFGWGLYFTDLKDIAIGYAKSISTKVRKRKGIKLPPSSYRSKIINDIIDNEISPNENEFNSIIKKEIERVKNEINNTEDVEYQIDMEDYLKSLDNVKSINDLRKGGFVYDVTIHKGKTPDQYTWLEWDKPVSQTLISKVKKELSNQKDRFKEEKKYNKNAEYLFDFYDKALNSFSDYRIVNGNDLYKALSIALKSDKEASLFLLENGIDGVKYPAESISRGTTSDTARGFNYVVFDENAVTIEMKSKAQLHAELEISDGWYSSIEKKLLETKIEKQSANKWLTGDAIGKGDEATYTGVRQWLESKNPQEQVSKKDIIDWMRENRVEVEEVVKGAKGKMSQEEMDDVYNSINEQLSRTNQPQEIVDFVQEKLNNWYDNPSDSNYKKLYNALWKANLNLDDFIEDAQGEMDDTRYYNYQLPGDKTDYKEVLVTLPGAEAPGILQALPIFDTLDFVKNQYGVGSSAYERVKQDAVIELSDKLSMDEIKSIFADYESKEKTLFKSTHFDEPNILVHLRMNTRTDADGNKVLFLEEVQSDWGQTGKKEGFSNISQPDYKKLKTEYDDLYDDVNNKPLSDEYKRNLSIVKGQGLVKDADANVWFKPKTDTEMSNKDNIVDIKSLDEKTQDAIKWLDESLKSRRVKQKKLNELKEKLEKSTAFGPPEAPFVTDTKAWTKLGLKTALKEAVAQDVDKIAWTTGEQQNERYDLSKQVDGIKYKRFKKEDSTKGMRFGEDFYSLSMLKDQGMGVDLETGMPIMDEIQSEKDIPESKLESYVGKELAKKIIDSKDSEKTFTGVDLKVGGKGMKGFYDKIVPDAAKSLVKELTGKEGVITQVKLDEGTTQQAIDITPELKDAVERGMPLFSKAQLTEEEVPGYDRMMAEVEGIVEKSKSRGVSPDKIFENVMNYVKGSKVYETADDVQREQIVRDVRKMFGKREKAAPSFAKIFGVIKDTKKITMSERELLKKQIRDLARGARDAKKAMNETRESIASALRGMVRSGKLSSKQAATVLRKYSRVDLLNPAKVSDFVDYMVNVFADAEYVEKISRAKKLVARAKKNIKSKLGSGVNIVPDMERILSISPEMIPNNVMDVYMSILEVMGSTEAVLSLPEIGEMTTMINNVLDAVDTQHSLAEELALRFDAYEDKVFEDGKLKFEKTLEKMIEEDKITEEDAALMRKYKNQIIEEEREDTVQEEEDNTELISTVKSTDVNESNLPMREDRDKARRLAELAKTNAVNSLNKRDLNALLKIIDNINNGYMPHSAQLMIEKLVSINNSDLITKAIEKSKLAPISSVVARMKKIFSKSKDAVQLMVERNPLYYIDQMLGDYKSKAVFNTIFEKLSEAQAVFNNKSNALTKRLEDVKNNVLKSVGGKMNNLIMSSYKMSTYMRELEYLSNPGSKKVNSAVDYLKATIKHMKTNLKFAEAKMLQDILDNYVVDGKLDIDKLYNSFNSAEKNAIKEFQKINEEMFPMAIHTAGVVRGNRIKPINNYSHIQVLTDYGTSSEASAISDATDYGKRLMPSTKGKSLLERKDKVSVLPIEFDIFSSVERGARFVMLDYYMTEPIRIVHRTLNRVNKNLEASDKINKKNLKVFNAIKLGVQSAIENVLLNNYIMNSWIDDVSNFITKQGYRAILAGVARSSAEFASNLSMAIKNPIAFAKGVKMYGMIFTPDAVDFANNVGSKQTERLFGSDPLSGKMIESSLISKRAGIRSMEVRNSVVNYIEMLYNKSLKKYKNSVELIADTLISTPDKSVLRPIWFGSFAQKFEDIRGRKFTDSDFKMIASNDERYMSENAYVIDMAKKYADENSVYAGATDNPFMGILKGKSSIEKSVAMKLIDNFNNFMTRFAIFEYTSARTGINAMVGNGTMSKAEGARLLAAVVLRMTMYSILTKEFAELLARPWTDDDDDEEDEKSFNQKVGQAAASTGVSLILGRDFGNFARGLISIGAEDVNEKFLQELRNGEYDPYKDAITYSIVPTDNTLEGYIIRMSGSLGPALKTAQLMLKNSGKRKEAEAIKIQEQNKNLRIPLELAGHAGLVPFYKDIRSIVVNEINKSIEQQEKRTKANKEKSKAEASKNIKKVRDAKNRMRMMNIEITPGVESVLNDYTRYYEEKQSESPDAKFINDFDEMRRERDEMKEKLLDEAKAFSITEIKKINPAAYRKNFGPGSEYYRKYNDLNIVERNMKGVKKKWGED